jgi:hypothetical protein
LEQYWRQVDVHISVAAHVKWNNICVFGSRLPRFNTANTRAH